MSELKPIEPLILTLRRKKVILDAGLAAACGVKPRVLNQAVKRNPDRFPDDFMFQLTRNERFCGAGLCEKDGAQQTICFFRLVPVELARQAGIIPIKDEFVSH